jgi:hypothetical protein
LRSGAPEPSALVDYLRRRTRPKAVNMKPPVASNAIEVGSGTGTAVSTKAALSPAAVNVLDRY